MTLRWGLLSTARINDALLDSGTDQEFGAVASRSLERAREYADDKGIARAHGSYEELLTDPDVDAIYNPLPNSMHVDWSIRALQAGKHVLSEKPLSRHPADVERAFAVAEEAGLVFAEAFMWRHHPQAAKAAELVSSGAIGELRIIRAAFSFRAGDPGDIRLQAALDGGGLMDVGSYCISGCRLLAGAEPERAYLERADGGDGVDVAGAAVLRFPGDVLAHFDCGLAYPGGGYLAALGTEGAIHLSDPWHAAEPVIELHRGGEVEQVDAGAGANSYALELADFAAAVAGEKQPLLGRDDALGQARTIAALYQSAEEGTPCPIN